VAQNNADFFGVNMLGADPYAARVGQMANVLKAFAPSGANSQRGGGLEDSRFSQSNPDPWSYQGTPSATAQRSGSLGMSELPRFIQSMGGPQPTQSSWMGSAKSASESGSNTNGGAGGPPGVPGSQEWNEWQAQYGNQIAGGGTNGVASDGGRIPTDLVQLREHLQNWSLAYLQNPDNNPHVRFEDLQLGADPSWGQYNNYMMNAANQGGAGMTGAYNALMGNARMDWSPLNKYAGWADAGMAGTSDLTRSPWFFNPETNHSTGLNYMSANGGMPAIQSGLDAIRASGMKDLDVQLANIREQYGSRGLGAGSDIATALGEGASRGIADMNMRQSDLLANMQSQAAQRQLQAQQIGQQNAIQGQYGYAQNLMNLNSMATNTANVHGNLMLGGQTNQLGAYNSAGQLAGGYGNMMANLAPGLGAYPQMQQQLQQGNLDRVYGEILRRAQGPPALANIMNYASAVPAQQYIPPRSNPWMNVIGAGAQLGSAAILAASDRNIKYDIEEAPGVLSALKNLPIATWKYKGDDVKHIGPMAQDFQESFGVGDGKNIALVDVMGVLLASMKELASGPVVKHA
jgi:hypothetical protein